MSIERRKITSEHSEQTTNGIDASSPLPDRLREQERRISAALTDDRSASDLADLLQQTDWAVISAEEFAQLENEKALDVLQSPDPTEAMRSASSAAFLANRLRAMRPRLLARYQEIVAHEQVQEYLAKRDELKLERDTLEQELTEVYTRAAGEIVALFQRVNQFKRRAQQQLGNPPPGVHVLQAIDGLRVLDNCVLPEFEHPDRNVWPPPSTFAATFAQSMGVPPHPGAAWWREAEAKAAERQAEAAHTAAYYAEATKQQELRKNEEERAAFAAHQQRN
jgi:uncharacterized protein (UPF0335 family)